MKIAEIPKHCERCGQPHIDYCGICDRDRCRSCMQQGCCGHVPAISGTALGEGCPDVPRVPGTDVPFGAGIIRRIRIDPEAIPADKRRTIQLLVGDYTFEVTGTPVALADLEALLRAATGRVRRTFPTPEEGGNS